MRIYDLNTRHHTSYDPSYASNISYERRTFCVRCNFTRTTDPNCSGAASDKCCVGPGRPTCNLCNLHKYINKYFHLKKNWTKNATAYFKEWVNTSGSGSRQLINLRHSLFRSLRWELWQQKLLKCEYILKVKWRLFQDAPSIVFFK